MAATTGRSIYDRVVAAMEALGYEHHAGNLNLTTIPPGSDKRFQIIPGRSLPITRGAACTQVTRFLAIRIVRDVRADDQQVFSQKLGEEETILAAILHPTNFNESLRATIEYIESDETPDYIVQQFELELEYEISI